MNIKIADFLTKARETAWLCQFHVVWFVGQGDFPLYFFSCICKRLREEKVCTQMTAIHLDQYDLSSLQAMIATSFLGMRTSFWLGDSSTLASKSRAALLAQLATHQGPNQCLIFVAEKEATTPEHHLVVECDEYADKLLFEACARFMHGALTERDRLFISKLYATKRKISLDTACLLAYYVRLCANDYEKFSGQVLNHVCTPDSSLFTLAQYFFARNRTAFFKEWHALYPLYPDLFWVSFWSEQFWRAYHYIRLSQERRAADAKSFTRKLPFSFINYDWKRAKPDELKDLLARLYDLDTRLKSSMSAQGAFELLFLEFFKSNEKTTYPASGRFNVRPPVRRSV